MNDKTAAADPAAVVPAPDAAAPLASPSGASAATPPASQADASSSASSTAPSAAAGGADSKTESKPESTPSLLASADAAKRDGAPAAPDAPKPAEQPSPDGAKAKPETADGKAPEVKAEDGKDKPKDGADAAAKDALAEKPPASPTYEPPMLPEGIKLDDKALAQVDKRFGDFELAHKVDHAAMQSLRQELISEHLADRQVMVEQIFQYQRDHWNRINETRLNELKADPALGGNRIETAFGNAKHVLESYLGKDDTAKLLPILDNGGVSNSRLFIKLLNEVYERHREPQPVTPNHPAASKLMSKPGQRSWYDTVDVKSA